MTGFVDPNDVFSQLLQPGSTAPVVRAAPTGPAPMPASAGPPVAPPIQAPAQGNILSMILSALAPQLQNTMQRMGAQTPQGFHQAVADRNASGIARADQAIQHMQRGNADLRQRFSQPMGGGPQVDTASVAPSGAIDPLALFGGATPAPPPKPGDVPTPQQIVSQAQPGPPLSFTPPGHPPPPDASSITAALGPQPPMKPRPQMGARYGQP